MQFWITMKTTDFLFLFLLGILLFASEWSFSQTNESIPYSRYGLGTMHGQSLNINNSLGGLSYGINENDQINLANPASYGFFQQKSFIFETGIETVGMELSTSDTTQTTYNTSISFLAFGFPVTKWWGSSFGIKPFSTTSYQLVDVQNDANTGQVTYNYNGEGGINQFYWGNGFRWKGIAAGINTCYLFGPIEKYKKQIFENTNMMHYYTNEVINVGAFYFNYGIQLRYTMDTLFNKEIKDKITFTLGGVFDASTELAARRKSIGVTFNQYAEDPFLIFPRDTIIHTQDTGTLTLPQSIGLGFTIKKGEQWLIGADYQQRYWSQFLAFNQGQSLVNSKKYIVGIQFTPNQKSTNYLKTVQYRMGYYYANTHLNLKGDQLSQYGTSFGVGLPLKRFKSNLNVGAEVGRRGTIEDGLIMERYWKIKLGLTLNDVWFIKRKFD